MLAWLEETHLAIWCSTSTWGYPGTLAAHGIGMAIVVGITAVICLRILGFPKGISIAALRGLVPVFIFGLLLNGISGLILFMADASNFFYNIAFQIKMLMIVIGIYLVRKIDQIVLRPAVAESVNAVDGMYRVSQKARIYAVLSLLIWWFSVVLSGRLIGYVIYT